MNDKLRVWGLRVLGWTVLASLWAADMLIAVMLVIRANERRVRPMERTARPRGLKQQLMRQQDNNCLYCGYRRRATSLDIDHITPVARGGATIRPISGSSASHATSVRACRPAWSSG